MNSQVSFHRTIRFSNYFIKSIRNINCLSVKLGCACAKISLQILIFVFFLSFQMVLIVVTFLAAATLVLGANVLNEPSVDEPVPILISDPGSRNAKQVGQPGAGPGAPLAPENADAPDDLKADGTFGLLGYYGGWGGWGGYGGGWGGYGRYGGGWGGWGGYRRPYGGWGGYYGW